MVSFSETYIDPNNQQAGQMSAKGSYFINEGYEGYQDKPTSEQPQKQIMNHRESETSRANPSQGSSRILLAMVIIVCIISLVVLLLTILVFEKIDDRCNCAANEGQ